MAFVRMKLGSRVLFAFVLGMASLAGLSALASRALSQADGAPDDLLGKPARAWHVEHWINSAPLELSELRGKVVLVRFWTAPGCPFCRATAPALNDFHTRYASRGLRVVGFYHHKARSPLEVDDVAHYARTFGFRFPVAIDRDWRTLRDWWLNADQVTRGREFTSVTFLIDRRGIIRHIHPGGQYVRGDEDYARMQASIEALCVEAP